MIAVTGAAGFIGSCMVQQLNDAGYKDLILVDDFSLVAKNRNFVNKQFIKTIHRDVFVNYFQKNATDFDAIIHFGARTDTTETDIALFDRLNLNYTKALWNICSEHQIPLIYASSAATYGLGELGYEDKHDICKKLEPLNAYGRSKNDFDIWALEQDKQPPYWAGLKFFNVYGPNEFHKGRMASVIFHTHRQINATGGMRLFRSHNPNYKDGEQQRDFIYVKDVVNMAQFLLENQKESGLYNFGTGTARTFWDLAASTFRAMKLEPNISFMDTPIDIRDKYQYFTEATMDKIRRVGYSKPFYTLEEGIEDYVQQHLMTEKYF